MILAFDVGNTETVLGVLREGRVSGQWRLATRPERTADELALVVKALLADASIRPGSLSGAVVGSVVPPLTPAIVTVCEQHLATRALLVDAATPLPIRLEVDEPMTVGADRIANTLAAVRLYGRDTIVVDLGTATTFDCIRADGAFVGGVISPGVRTGADMLVSRTAKLPRVDLEPPATVIGRRTESSLMSGIFHGAVAAIDGIVDRIRAEWGREDVLVVATGGLAPMLAPHCRTVERVEPHLTLYGLELAWRHVHGPTAGDVRLV
ncbi:MAG: type III pantothenate kinase [Gemmatimonadota bacterium]